MDDEIVEGGPIGVVEEELFECAVGHWAAPDEGFVLLDERADGDGVDSVNVMGKDAAAANLGGDAFDAEHGGH